MVRRLSDRSVAALSAASQAILLTAGLGSGLPLRALRLRPMS